MKKIGYSLKKASAFLLAAAMLFILASCGSAQETGKESTSAAGTEPAGTAAPAAETTAVTENEAEPEEDPVDALREAYEGLTQDELTWSYDETARTITIGGEGPMRDYTDEAPEWDCYYEEAERIVIEDGVTSVGALAFYSFTCLNEVTLADSVEFIGNDAFWNCIELRSLRFSEKLRYVGEGSFCNTLLHSENGFVLPEGLLYIGDLGFHSAFKGGSITIPASLTYIGAQAVTNGSPDTFIVAEGNPAYKAEDGVLYSADGKTLICYPMGKRNAEYAVCEGTETILAEAIMTTEDLKTLTIPASVTKIEEAAVFWNYGLTEIVVDESCSAYMTVDGMLYTADGKTLLCCPCAGQTDEIVVREGTERIAEYAFSSVPALRSVTVPEGVTSIGDGAFWDTQPEVLALPASLKKIETNAFSLPVGEIRFAGTREEWEAVTIADGNDGLTGVPVGFAK